MNHAEKKNRDSFGLWADRRGGSGALDQKVPRPDQEDTENSAGRLEGGLSEYLDELLRGRGKLRNCYAEQPVPRVPGDGCTVEDVDGEARQKEIEVPPIKGSNPEEVKHFIPAVAQGSATADRGTEEDARGPAYANRDVRVGSPDRKYPEIGGAMTNFRPAGFDPVQDALRFHVAPRYTVGSPGMVRSIVATEYAKAEERKYSEMVSGLDGEYKKEEASRLGLSGIVEERWDFRGRKHFRDLITGEVGILDPSGRREVVYGKVAKTHTEG